MTRDIYFSDVWRLKGHPVYTFHKYVRSFSEVITIPKIMKTK